MKTRTYRIIIVILIFFAICQAKAQQAPAVNNAKPHVQPTIMVVPFAKEGEDIRTVLEADFNRRLAITKVKEAFDKRHFSTIDFTAKLKAAMDKGIFNGSAQGDVKSKMLDFADPDIYVQVEVPPMITTAGGNAARLLLTAFLNSGGTSLANADCESPKFFTTDYGALVEKALGKSETIDNKVTPVLEQFLNTMQEKFDDIVENGRPIEVDFVLAQGSKLNFSTEIKPEGTPLAYLLDQWMEENAKKNIYHSQGATDLGLTYDEVRVPVLDENGRSYQLSKFSQKIYMFLKSKGIKCGLPATVSGKITVTIN